MSNKNIKIKIFAPPVGECSYEKSWKFAAEILSSKLNKHFKDLLEVKFIELFTPESFEYTEIMNLLKNDDTKPPYILLNDEIIQIGGILSERLLKEKINDFLRKQDIS